MTNRWLGLAAAAAAIAFLVLGTLSNHWLRGIDLGIESHLGLRAIELCQTVEPTDGVSSRSCVEVSLAAMVDTPSAPAGFDRFRTLASGAYMSGLVAAALLALCLVVALVNRPVDLPIHPTTLGILGSLTALTFGGLTMTLNPYTRLVGWGSGGGFVLFGVGAALGLFAAIVLGRARPHAPDDF